MPTQFEADVQFINDTYPHDFAKAITETLEHEGGFQNHRKDRGNWTSGIIGQGKLKGTKYGISAMKYGHLDIENITYPEAVDIYYRDYWKPYNYTRFILTNVSSYVFSNTVVMGPSNSHKVLQRALRACGHYTPADGLIGPQTWMKTNEASNGECVHTLLAALISESAAHYRIISAKSPNTYGKFKKGWLRRAYRDQY